MSIVNSREKIEEKISEASEVGSTKFFIINFTWVKGFTGPQELKVFWLFSLFKSATLEVAVWTNIEKGIDKLFVLAQYAKSLFLIL